MVKDEPSDRALGLECSAKVKDRTKVGDMFVIRAVPHLSQDMVDGARVCRWFLAQVTR